MSATTSQSTLELVMTDDTVDRTLAFVATMVGLPRETVAKIVEASLPMMASMADENPYVFKAMFAQSRMPLPAPSAELYKNLKKSADARQAQAAAFETIYGDATAALNREAARRANATAAQAGQVLAATMPAVIKAVGTQNVRGNEMGFGLQLRRLTA